MSLISNQEGQLLQSLIRESFDYKGQALPNPTVGALLLASNGAQFKGFHTEFGGPHAEVIAIDKAGPLAAGATLLVTLEPCTHTGKTPPCVDKIIEAGIHRVIWAVDDPNPTVYQTAKKQLSAHGIAVVSNCFAQLGLQLIKEWAVSMCQKRPFMYLKLAVSQDGYIAGQRQRCQYISSTESLNRVQQLRHINSAILVGVDTINIDRPLLSIRHKTDSQPHIVILDPNGRISIPWLESTAALGRDIVLFTLQHVSISLRLSGIQHVPVLLSDKVDNWSIIMQSLHEMGVISVLVEGGASVAFSLLQSNAFNECWIFSTAHVLEGPDAVPFKIPSNRNPLQDYYAIAHTEMIGEDVLTIYKNSHVV